MVNAMYVQFWKKDTKEEEWKSLKIEDKIEALKKRIEKLEAKDKRY